MAGLERDGDVIVLRLAGEERPVLASLAASLAEMLEPAGGAGDNRETDPLAAMVGMGSDSPVASPDDPALRRLLPDAYGDDPDGAAEFRRLTDAGLRAEKAANLRRILDGATAAGGVVRIDPGEADGWLAGLNDIRLVIGERLEMTEEREHLEDLAGDDPRVPLLAAYDWLSFLQEAILELLMGD